MAVYPLYKDFFRFLEALETTVDPWGDYQERYIQPHREFFEAYWKTFPLFAEQLLRDRVLQIKRGHYAILEHLVVQKRPEAVVTESLSRCLDLLPRFPEPDVYLMIGFFSADGFIVEVEGWPAIGMGLERFKDFRLLEVILAHEYCHYARRLALGASPVPEHETLGQRLLSEGLSVVFSRRVFPRRKLEDHLLMSRRRLNWCQQNEALLESMARKGPDNPHLVPIMFGPGKPEAGIPPRSGMYLGYRLMERALVERGEEAFEELLGVANVTSVWFGDEQMDRDE